MLPISIKQQQTMKKTTKIQNKLKEIQFKYKNDPENLNRATMELYKTENMSPFSGCFSAIVQIILLFAVFYLVRSPLTYMKKVDNNIINKYSSIIKQNGLSINSNYPEIEIIRELENIKELKNSNSENEQKEETENKTESTEQTTEINNNENTDQTTSEEDTEKIDLEEINDEELNLLYINMDFLGLNLAQVPTGSTDWKTYIIPALYVIVSIVSLRISNPTKKKEKNVKENNTDKEIAVKEKEEFDPMLQMNKNMNIMYPIMYLLIAMIAPLGLALYWLMNSLLMIIEKLILNKVLKDEEE